MPYETRWRLVVGLHSPTPTIRLYPELEGGILGTFPHQDFNAAGPDWRLGKPCLDRRSARFGREDWHDEPVALGERVGWHLGRLLNWIDAAARGDLFQPGDPLELPPFPPGNSAFDRPVLAFNEAQAALFRNPHGGWGLASTAPVGASRARVLVDLWDSRGRLSAQGRWNGVVDPKGAVVDTIWVDLPVLPVRLPWELPATWRQLRDRLTEDGVDLAAIVTQAGAAMRAGPSGPALDRLAFAFPFAERVGGVPDRRHWLAVKGLRLAAPNAQRRGFRPTEANRCLFDAEIVNSDRRLEWLQSRSWESDSLRRRGQADEALRSMRVLILGAGCLGSAVADLLVRMGVLKLGIMDDQVIEAGNLSRHVLNMDSVGRFKAWALARYLNTVASDVAVEGYVNRFPPNSKVEGVVRGYDVVIDCTGEDGVLRAMADFDWRGEKHFISLGMTWGAEGLLAFAASESVFPVEDALYRFAGLPAPRVDIDDAQVEGAGCWSPVFPASAEQVKLWAATAVGFIREATKHRRRRCAYYQRGPDGTVTRIDRE